MSTVLVAMLAGAAGAVMYVFCIRPMLHSHGHCAAAHEFGRNADLNLQIADLREEIRVLRAQDCLDDVRRGTTRSHPPEATG